MQCVPATNLKAIVEQTFVGRCVPINTLWDSPTFMWCITQDEPSPEPSSVMQAVATSGMSTLLKVNTRLDLRSEGEGAQT